jgi:hypothetical protein
MDECAYSTDNPAAVAAYRQALTERNAYTARIRPDLEALGAGPSVYFRSSGFPGSPDRVSAIEHRGDHVPDGWRLVRGSLEPRRGKPGEDARRWLAAHQPVDVRHVMESHGLPRASWLPREREFGWQIVSPYLFEYDGTLWACYASEPGTTDSGFDRQRCTWTRRKLSEFHAAREAMEAATAAAGAVHSA